MRVILVSDGVTSSGMRTGLPTLDLAAISECAGPVASASEIADLVLAEATVRDIVFVGPCAAGKSTLVSALQSLGYDARVSGQEHSEISTVWQHAEPDVLIALDVDIAAVRERRGGTWPEWLHDLQVQRLAAASAAADLAIDTTAHSAQTVIERVVAHLEGRRASDPTA